MKLRIIFSLELCIWPWLLFKAFHCKLRLSCISLLSPENNDCKRLLTLAVVVLL